ncbi:MAG: hypothetical protein EHM25_11585 [Nitrosopumilales archaeon]|nr:MAG: hypothetical protein EHM25_11585 [Nitrosopumilales archaeon]
MAQKVNRPIGVTIIAILTIIIGIIAIFGGISLVAFFLSVTPIGLTNNNNSATTTEDSSSQLVVQVFGVAAAIAGAILLAIGVGYIVMSYGLIKSKSWAWTWTIILVLVGIVIQILSAVTGPVFNTSFVGTNDTNVANSLISGIVGSVIGIAISIIILWYLYRPSVKTYFGKTQQSRQLT